MRKKKIIKIFFYSFLIGTIIVNWNITLEHNVVQYNNKMTYLDRKLYLKISGTTNLTGTPIFIDDSDPNYNWSKTVAENGWCTGVGTENDPYIIESVYIDGLGSQTCITVQNSDLYFTVNNSIFVNTEYSSVGLRLINITNGELRNNTFSNHQFRGAELFNVNNSLIVENYINDNTNYGIELDHCQNISIINNKLFENDRGLYTHSSSNITITENEAYLNEVGFFLSGLGDHLNVFENVLRDNHDNGITLSVENSIITRNNFLDNGIGIFSYGDNCTISNNDFVNSSLVLKNSLNNTIINNKVYNSSGIVLEDLSRNNLIHQNELYNNAEGIRIIYHPVDTYATYNIISKNDIIDSREEGISLYHACNNIIQDNSIISSKDYGIRISDCENNTIKNNVIESSNSGIYLHISINDTILDNTIRYNNIGFTMYTSQKTQISNNLISHNNVTGLEMSGSTKYNIISENNISYNGLYGIYALDLGPFNNITHNDINYNEVGICLNNTHHNYIIGNYLRGNAICIQEVDSNDNVIEDNMCDTSEPSIIPGYNVYLFLGMVFFLGIVITFKFNRNSSKKQINNFVNH